MYEAAGLVSKLGSEGIASPVHVASSQFAAIVFKLLNDRDSVEFPPVSEKVIQVYCSMIQLNCWRWTFRFRRCHHRLAHSFFSEPAKERARESASSPSFIHGLFS